MGETRVVVIGGGPAGVSAALHAAELGAEVTLIERGRVGGTAFNSGPAPVRTWLGPRAWSGTGRHPGQRPAGRRLPIPGAELGLTYEDVRNVTALPERVCITGAAVHQLESLKPGVRVLYRVGEDSRVVDVDAAFFAVGWPGNADLVDAAAAGVATERGYVTVDAFAATNVPHIFAAGDVDGNSMLVSSATIEGRVAAENAVLGPRRRVGHEIVPAGSFTDPEYGSVGLTEEQARARYDCVVAVARYEDMLRPVADGQPEGFCKLIVETAERKIVGAHVFGEFSAEVIQMVATAVAAEMRVEDVAELQFAFPTFTEGVGQAAQMVVNQLGVRPMSRLWSSLSTTPSVLE